MDYIEFDTRLGLEGTVRIPEEYRRKILGSDLVHVTIAKVNSKPALGNGTIRNMMEHPYFVADFKAPSRDELYERE